MEELKSSLAEYNSQLSLVNQALAIGKDSAERESLLTLKTDLNQLIHLTQESLESLLSKESTGSSSTQFEKPKMDNTNELDDEYALFMNEMAKSGAYEVNDHNECTKDSNNENSDSDVEDELATLLGMKCAVYHTHKWGGQPTLHNAMVSAVVPRQNDDQFNDIQVRVLFTHPTHTEMLPCPFFLDGDCKFNDEQCRYSHGSLVQLSQLKDAIDPDFDSIKVGSRILLKLKPPDDEDISLTKKATEKYHLWHRSIVKSVDLDKRSCIVKLEQGIKTGEKRKSCSDEFYCKFEEIFPLNNENEDSESDDSISDTEYPERKNVRSDVIEGRNLLIEQSLVNNSPAMGEWERHTRGIGSKLMLAMGYVPGTGLGSEGRGRVQPVEARIVPLGKSLDHCMALTEKAGNQDPLKVEQKLKRLQKKEEERNKRAYEREKERERRNVFNFINKTLGDKPDEAEPSSSTSSINIKQSTSKDLNIEHFKITEDTKKIEREIVKLNNSLSRQAQGTSGHRSIAMQINEKTRELHSLRDKEKQITKEQIHRKDKKKMTVF